MEGLFMDSRRPWFLDLWICWMVLVAFCSLSLLTPDVQAAMIQSRLAGGDLASTRAAEMESIRLALEKDVVAQRLTDYGLSKEEVMAKLPSLSDEQIHQLAGLSDDLAAGDGGLGTVIAVLLIILLVIVILRLMDKRVVIR